MIRFWDIRTGSSIKTLTQHKKGIRAMVIHPEERTFASAGADKFRIWCYPEGEHMRSFIGDKEGRVQNCLALNEDNVLVSGGDDGVLNFFDWKSGKLFQSL